MSDEPELTEAAPQDEPASEPTESRTEPAAPAKESAPAPEPEPTLPPWLTQPIPDSAPQPEYRPQYVPQQQGGPYYYPPPQPPPPPPPGFQQRRPIRLDDIANDPDGTINAAIESRAMQMVGPIVGKLIEIERRVGGIDSQTQAQHGMSVAREFEISRAAVKDAYDQVFMKDPAFRNPGVNQRVEAALRGYILKGVREAHETGDTTTLEAVRNPKILRTVLHWAKEEAGWGQDGQRVDIKGAFTESSKPGQRKPDIELSDELRESAKFHGISEDVLLKRLEERRKLGW